MSRRLFGHKLNLGKNLLFWSMSCAGQRFVPRVDPGLSWLDRAGDQKDSVLAGIVLPVKYTQ